MGRDRSRSIHKGTTKSHHQQQRNSKIRPSKIRRRQHSQVKQASTIEKTASSNKTKTSPHPQRPARVPFARSDRVLLVGEGDFSFAASLVKHHHVDSVIATSYDDGETLLNKYPNIRTTLNQLQTPFPSVHTQVAIISDANSEWNGFSDDEGENDSIHSDSDSDSDSCTKTQVSILYGIDATKLSSTHRKALTQHSPGRFTKIVFNFPHTGGLSTDVNRQVRANQQLLVSFFNAAKPLLLSSVNLQDRAESRNECRYNDIEDDELKSNSHGQKSSDLTLNRPCILVTLFEREPYTLWNIRDLARHCGLEVIESSKFPWDAYPGYQHARTAGDITTGLDRAEEGKRKGAWRGEERNARTYIFGLKGNTSNRDSQHGKRKRNINSEDESD